MLPNNLLGWMTIRYEKNGLLFGNLILNLIWKKIMFLRNSEIENDALGTYMLTQSILFNLWESKHARLLRKCNVI